MGNLVSRREFLKVHRWRGRGRGGITDQRGCRAGRGFRWRRAAIQSKGGRQGRLAQRQPGCELHLPGCVVALRAREDGNTGARWRGPQPGHRRVQHACARTWAVRSSYDSAQRVFKCPCHFSIVRRREGRPDDLRPGHREPAPRSCSSTTTRTTRSRRYPSSACSTAVSRTSCSRRRPP